MELDHGWFAFGSALRFLLDLVLRFVRVFFKSSLRRHTPLCNRRASRNLDFLNAFAQPIRLTLLAPFLHPSEQSAGEAIRGHRLSHPRNHGAERKARGE